MNALDRQVRRKHPDPCPESCDECEERAAQADATPRTDAAVMHCDQTAVGFAELRECSEVNELSCYQAERALDDAVRQRDAAEAEVGRLRAALWTARCDVMNRATARVTVQRIDAALGRGSTCGRCGEPKPADRSCDCVDYSTVQS